MPEQVQEITDLTKSIQSFLSDQKTLNAALDSSSKATGEDAKSAIAKAEECAKSIAGISAQILEIEQKMTDNVIAGTADIKTLGAMVIASDAYKQFAGGTNTKLSFQANTIIGQDGSPLENSGVIVPPQRLGGIIGGASRMLKISEILPQGVTASNTVEYTKELLFTNNAAETNEGVASTESVLTFDLANAFVASIRTHLYASKQVLDDAPMLASYIDTRLRYASDVRLDTQLLTGNGTSPNISGMLDTGNFTAFTPTTGENALDGINRGIEAVFLADYAPTAIILNPADWFAIERLKVNAGTDDRYIIGNPSTGLMPVLWGYPVIVSNAMTAGQFLVASFDIAYQQWNRAGTTVQAYEQDGENALKSQVTIVSERRAALASYRPASAQSGALTI